MKPILKNRLNSEQKNSESDSSTKIRIFPAVHVFLFEILVHGFMTNNLKTSPARIKSGYMTLHLRPQLIRSVSFIFNSFDIYPVPTWLVQEFAPIFAPFFAHVFNVSLERGYLPASQKKAIVYPGLKKPSLDPDDLSNYRPISNLSFVSKLLERAVHAQLLLYLNDNELLPSVQSAYRQFFSTETAVLKVVTDILAALDRGQISLLGHV